MHERHRRPVTGATPCFVEAGTKLQDLVAKEPFQEGFLAATWDGAGGQAATVAVEKAAMLLMGQWAPGTMQANTRRPAAGQVGPRLVPVPGRRRRRRRRRPTGSAAATASPSARTHRPRRSTSSSTSASKEHADRWGALNTGILPVTVGAESSVTDRNLTSVLAARAKANFVQLYLDQATTPELGGVINDAVATLFAGTGYPGAGDPDHHRRRQDRRLSPP